MFRDIILLCVVILTGVKLAEQVEFLNQDYIDRINKVASKWKAGMNFDPKLPKESIVKLFGTKEIEKFFKPINQYKSNDPVYGRNQLIPLKFDARKQWPRCDMMNTIQNQGFCGSSWAHAVTGAFADRLCIATDGQFNQLVSAEELTFCCHLCGFGCHGGYPINAWTYLKRHGVVTGGSYNTTDGCQPYRVPPCDNFQGGPSSCYDQLKEKNHKCSRSCYGNKTINYNSDHRKTRDAYYLNYNSIQKDIKYYGPVVASFDVYDDFVSYKSGIYEVTEKATYLGKHAVKVIGWGIDYNNTEYWLMVNSWGRNWGDGGLFKIRKGTNECRVDDSFTGGVPVF
ncbi:Peptidase C1A, papain C-terminal,Peptidase C1A, propeptide [Cinara cedri]|uniref:Peptidase C1A, papain C-terminal,Peptidase C1A, propeptide n=1 Tax=Cinara cedri TaxID=506608 RepID=A0A5E4MAP3_9HEMI|nr:Peptidase C1A, papain C-terminal,Peptidase C1A, propeptide [Cinara cedri]